MSCPMGPRAMVMALDEYVNPETITVNEGGCGCFGGRSITITSNSDMSDIFNRTVDERQFSCLPLMCLLGIPNRRKTN